MTRARVARFEHALGAGERAWRTPHPALVPLLGRDLVGYRHVGIGFGAWLEPPRPEVTLMIDLDGSITANGTPLPPAWIGGLGRRYTVVGVGAAYGSIELNLSPLGAYAVLGMPLSEITDACVELSDAFGPVAVDAMVDRVREATSWDERFDVVESFLLRRLHDPAAPRPEPAIEWAWRRLTASAGRLRIEGLAAELGVSRRYLSGRFQTHVGLPPKTVARQLRFAEVRRRIADEPGDWARIATDAGYVDQSHLHRDCRELAGVTPAQFVARLIPEGGLVGDGLSF